MDVDGRSDVEILRESLRDTDAFAEFYDRYSRDVLAWCYRRTADAQTAADLAAETFAQAFACRARYREDVGTPSAWLFGIAAHQVSRYWRRRRVERRWQSRLGMDRLEVSDVEADQIAAIDAVRGFETALGAAIATLSGGGADAVRLRIADGLSYAEIARRLGCSEGAARVRVSRALTRLAEALEVPR